ncbi:MAG: hypothetical protein ACRDUV_25005 [Pseudonocardiaceae bacterium]
MADDTPYEDLAVSPGHGDAAPSRSVHQTSYRVVCEVLRRVLVAAVQAGPGAAGGIGSVECQAVAALYLLLLDHPIDRWGRCRACRRLGAVFGPRWRHCRVHGKANLCLHQPEELLLLRLLVHELGLADLPPPAAPGRAPAGDPETTDVLPSVAADLPAQPLRGAGWPDPTHGEPGMTPTTSVSPCSFHPRAAW